MYKVELSDRVKKEYPKMVMPVMDNDGVVHRIGPGAEEFVMVKDLRVNFAGVDWRYKVTKVKSGKVEDLPKKEKIKVEKVEE